MVDNENYIEAVGEERPALDEQMALVRQQLDERTTKAERLRGEIDMLRQRGDPAVDQTNKLNVVEEEINVLRQRLAELHNQARQPEDAERAAAAGLVVGGIAQVAQNGGPSLELRTLPSLSEGGVIDRHQPGMQVTLLYGPEHADGHTWWRVRRIDGREGWIASDGLEGRPA